MTTILLQGERSIICILILYSTTRPFNYKFILFLRIRSHKFRMDVEDFSISTINYCGAPPPHLLVKRLTCMIAKRPLAK